MSQSTTGKERQRDLIELWLLQCDSAEDVMFNLKEMVSGVLPESRNDLLIDTLRRCQSMILATRRKIAGETIWD